MTILHRWYFIEGEDPEHKFEEFCPPPNNESLPNKIYQVAGGGVLVGRGKDSDEPWNHIAR
jgi:hypothetical protein